MPGHFGEIGFEFVQFDDQSRSGQIFPAFGRRPEGGGRETGSQKEDTPAGHDS
jgi:hypothetical protein